MSLTPRAFLSISAILFLLLLTGMIINPAAMAQTKFFKVTLVNDTFSLVNCPTVVLKVKLGAVSSGSAERGPRSWAPETASTITLGYNKDCLQSWIEATCVCLSDGWPRTLKTEPTSCQDTNVFFRLNPQGELFLSK